MPREYPGDSSRYGDQKQSEYPAGEEKLIKEQNYGESPERRHTLQELAEKYQKPPDVGKK